MATLYYIETKPNTLNELIKALKAHNLETDAVERGCRERPSEMMGRLIMWSDSHKYPAFVWLNQEPIIRQCGTKVEYI